MFGENGKVEMKKSSFSTQDGEGKSGDNGGRWNLDKGTI
jgi:hypothetical protein